jgi:hypothetical protein
MNDDEVFTLANSLDSNSSDPFALPEIVNIPTCTWMEIRENWKRGPGKAGPDCPNIVRRHCWRAYESRIQDVPSDGSKVE